MTSADATHRRNGALARGWRSFRRWRRGRPFWAGLFTLLGGALIYGSTQLSLGDIQLKIGFEGFQTYLIPLVLVLCGVLIWLTPQHRVFYGVIAAVVALYSFIGVNFGGFGIGMLLGVIGGSLAVAWTPITPVEAEQSQDPADGPPDGEAEAAPDEESGRHRADARMDELFTGPLTDVLPRPVNPLNEPAPRQRGHGADGHEGRGAESHGAQGHGAESHGAEGRWGAERPPGTLAHESLPAEERPGGSGNGTGGSLPRRAPRLFVITLVPLLLTAAVLANLRGTLPARAAPPSPYPSPCPVTKPSASAKAKPAPGASASSRAGLPRVAGTKPSAAPAQQRPPSASPSASATSTPTVDGSGGIGGVIDGIGDAVGDLLGSAAEPTSGPPATPSTTPTTSPSPASSASASPAPSEPAPTRSAAEPTKSPSATPKPTSTIDCVQVQAKELAATGVPPVQDVPDRMTGSKLTLDGFSFDGVTELTTGGGGTIRVLQFSMDKAVTENFELRVPGPAGRTVALTSSALTVQKAPTDGVKVKFYCSRFEGKLNLVGVEVPVDPLVFTPDSPPPLTLPQMIFTDIDIQLVFVDADQLLAPNLNTKLLAA